jgi:hypothetical protein
MGAAEKPAQAKTEVPDSADFLSGEVEYHFGFAGFLF